MEQSSGLQGTIGVIPNANYTPEFSHNLVSVRSLTELGYYVVFDDVCALVIDNESNEICAIGEIINNLYYIDLKLLKPSRKISNSKQFSGVNNNYSIDKWEKWHLRLHLPKSTVKILL